MILIADSGSTKTTWALVGDDIRKHRTQGLNPIFTEYKDIISNLEEVAETLHTENNKLLEICFYGAGCAGERGKEIMTNALSEVFGNAQQIEVNGDMIAACRATCGSRAGIVAILGTGSNSCSYNGMEIVDNMAALGYALNCDEGSGNAIGRKLIKSYLRKDMPTHLRTLWMQEVALDQEEILRKTYHEPYPNRFMASIAYFAKQHEEDPWINNLLEETFDEFVREQILKYDNYHRISFVGSVANGFRKQLKEVLNRYGLELGEVLKEPIEGLINYHKE